uniref:Clc-like protein 2 n=1 Tax=Plectus sambesii TaxID=2011161 RepID=A0A914VPP3_9BILA
MSITSVGRIVFLVLAAVFAIAGVAFSVAAIVTPAWQVVHISEFNTEHQHGLWMDCTRGKKHVEGTDDGSLHCTYKFDGSQTSHDGDENGDHSHGPGGEEQHKFFQWHKTVLSLIIAAILAGFIAVCFSFCAPCVKICAIVFNVFALIAAILSMVAMGFFFVNSHQTDFRFVHGVSRTYEQHKGYSFWLETAGTVNFIVSFIVGIVATVLLFLNERSESRPHKTWPKSNTSV